MRGVDVEERDEFEAITLSRDNKYNRYGSLLLDIGIRAPQVALSPLKPTHPLTWAMKLIVVTGFYVVWLPFFMVLGVAGIVIDAFVGTLADSYADMKERGG